MTMTFTTAEQYLAAFRGRQAYCRALIELSSEQQALVTNEDYPGLVALLTHKQQLIDALLESGREPADLWQSWRQDRDHLPGDVRQACEAALDDAEQLLRQVLFLETDSTGRLQQKRDVTERLLREVNHGHQALAAYESPPDPSAFRRLDLDL